MKIIELRRKSKEELKRILEDDREKLRQLRFDLSAGKVKNVREIRHIKKEIAQALTLIKLLNKQSTSERGRVRSREFSAKRKLPTENPSVLPARTPPTLPPYI